MPAERKSTHRFTTKALEACEQYQALADETASRGDWKAAAEYLSALVGLQPDNLASLSQPVGILREHGQSSAGTSAAWPGAPAGAGR